jgi:Family of unknown function (DUF5317)
LFALIAPPLLAAVAALAAGGSLTHWSRARLRWAPLALLALLVQIPLYTGPTKTWAPIVAIGTGAGIATIVLVLVVLLRNAIGPLRAACGLAALGVVLNLTVMLANGGWMPRADDRLAMAFDRGDLTTTVANTAPLTADSRLPWLGDVIPEPAWLPRADLISIGDLLLSLGGAWCAFVITRGRMLPQRDN